MTICHIDKKNPPRRRPSNLAGGSDELLRIGECMWASIFNYHGKPLTHGLSTNARVSFITYKDLLRYMR